MGLCIYLAEALTAAAILHAFEVRVWLWHLTEILSTTLPIRWPTVNLLSWTVIGFLFWAYLYLIYQRVVQLLFKRMELVEPHRSHLLETFWQSGFLACSLFSAATFLIEYGNSFSVWYDKLISDNIFELNDVVTPCSKRYFGIFCAFYIHDAWITTSRRGCSLAGITKFVFYVYMLSTHFMRCLRATYLFVMLLNMESLVACAAAVCCLFKRPGWRCGGNLPGLRLISNILFAGHLFIWIVNTTYLIPKLLILPAITVKVQQPDLFPLIGLNISLWTFFCLHILTSPAFHATYLYMRWAASGVKHRSLLDAALFAQESDVMKELQRIREKVARNRKARETAAARRSEQDYSGSPCQNNEQGLRLYQTIKCVMAIKRRLKKKREMQQAAQEDELPSSMTTPTVSSEAVEVAATMTTSTTDHSPSLVSLASQHTCSSIGNLPSADSPGSN